VILVNFLDNNKMTNNKSRKYNKKNNSKSNHNKEVAVVLDKSWVQLED